MITKKSGISLIILVITIVVILALLVIIILSVNNTNIYGNASKTKFLSDLENFKTELSAYIESERLNSPRTFDESLLVANDSSVSYAGVKEDSYTIYDIIPSLKQNSDYAGMFEITNGNLVYTGVDSKKSEWSKELDVASKENIITETGFSVNISEPSLKQIVSGSKIIYTINMSSDNPITTINLSNNLVVLDSNDTPLAVQPNITIGNVSGSDVDKSRNVNTTIDTTGLAPGNYKLKINSFSIKDKKDNTNKNDIISTYAFEIKSVLELAVPVINTNTESLAKSVQVTITSSNTDAKIQYSLDNQVTWNDYSVPLTVDRDNTTVFARAVKLDAISQIISKEITNIDDVKPTMLIHDPDILIAKAGSSVNYIVEYIDAYFDKSTLTKQDIVLNKTGDADGRVSVSGSGNTRTVTIDQLTGNGELSISIKEGTGVDTVGNVTDFTGPSKSFTVDNITPPSPIMTAIPTGWTNTNVKLHISYSSDTFLKEYSLDGTTWKTYTTDLDIPNNTTVYARATDVAGNQTAQSTLTITNIDKTPPIATFGTNGASGVNELRTTVTASDNVGSGIDLNKLQYVWDKQNITAPSSGWSSFTNGNELVKTDVSDGTYYLWIRASDNAANNIEVKSNPFNVVTQPPDITIDAPSKVVAKSSDNVTFTVRYNSPKFSKSTLAPANITLNKTGTASANVAVKGNGNTRTVTLSNLTGNGTVSIKINAGTATYTDGTQAPASGNSPEVIVDNILPTITISPPSPSAVTTGGSVSYIVTADDLNFDSITMVASNVSLNRTGSANGKISVSGTGNTRIVSIDNIVGSGYLAITIANGIAKDKAGNLSKAFGPSSQVLVDQTPDAPTYTLSKTKPTSPPITLTINMPKGGTELWYSFDGVNWIKYTNPLTITSNTVVYAYAKNSIGYAGNTSTITITNII